jgi:uncharacterized protein YecE (DUF72 family)
MIVGEQKANVKSHDLGAPRERREFVSDKRAASKILVGPAGWSYPDWKGIVYPKRRASGFHEATYLAGYFNTVELNVTFYRPVTAETSREWVVRVAHNKQFLFTAKLWREFTHNRDLSAENERAFRPGMEVLRDAGKLGALLAQFPWSFKNTVENLGHLSKLVERFRDFPLVVEVRHSSWDKPDVSLWLAERNVGFCNIDQPIIGRSLKPGERTTNAVGYVRLHGRNYKEWFRERPEGRGSEQRYNYLYEQEELEPWVQRIRSVGESAESTFVIANNHFEGKAIVNALQLIHMLTKDPVAIPPTLIEHYPELERISSRPASTPNLFQ